MFQSILVVCVGNICRSPTAECLLSHRLGAAFSVSSAGLAALVDQPMDASAQQVLAEHGLDWSAHRAKQINRQIISQHDLILVMEQQHLDHLLTLAPQARGKVFLLTHWLDQQDISDPYRQSKTLFEHVFNLIEQACDSWAKRLT